MSNPHFIKETTRYPHLRPFPPEMRLDLAPKTKTNCSGTLISIHAGSSCMIRVSEYTQSQWIIQGHIAEFEWNPVEQNTAAAIVSVQKEGSQRLSYFLCTLVFSDGGKHSTQWPMQRPYKIKMHSEWEENDYTRLWRQGRGRSLIKWIGLATLVVLDSDGKGWKVYRYPTHSDLRGKKNTLQLEKNYRIPRRDIENTYILCFDVLREADAITFVTSDYRAHHWSVSWDASASIVTCTPDKRKWLQIPEEWDWGKNMVFFDENMSYASCVGKKRGCSWEITHIICNTSVLAKNYQIIMLSSEYQPSPQGHSAAAGEYGDDEECDDDDDDDEEGPVRENMSLPTTKKVKRQADEKYVKNNTVIGADKDGTRLFLCQCVAHRKVESDSKKDAKQKIACFIASIDKEGFLVIGEILPFYRKTESKMIREVLDIPDDLATQKFDASHFWMFSWPKARSPINQCVILGDNRSSWVVYVKNGRVTRYARGPSSIHEGLRVCAPKIYPVIIFWAEVTAKNSPENKICFSWWSPSFPLKNILKL